MLKASVVVWKHELQEWSLFSKVPIKKQKFNKKSKQLDSTGQQKQSASKEKQSKKQDLVLINTAKRQKGTILYTPLGYGNLQEIILENQKENKVLVKINKQVEQFNIDEVFFDLPLQIKIMKNNSFYKEVGLSIPLYATVEELYQKIQEVFQDEKSGADQDNDDGEESIQMFQNGKELVTNKTPLTKYEMVPFTKILVISLGSTKMDTTLINDKQVLQLKEWLGSKKARFDLLYKASRDGHNPQTFHDKVQGFEQTIVLVQTDQNGYVIGGYAEKEWSKVGNYVEAQNNFLFSFKTLKKYPLNGKNFRNAQYCNQGYGPTWGGGHDLHISGTGQYCYSYLGNCYGHGLQEGTDSAMTELCGKYEFTCLDYEVFSVKM